jgi:hypothetical protein
MGNPSPGGEGRVRASVLLFRLNFMFKLAPFGDNLRLALILTFSPREKERQ